MIMNDNQIRQSFHNNILNNYHNCSNTLVIDELGIKHGKCRADIAVINDHFIGFELRSNKDTLNRLPNQIITYNTIFDYITIIIEKCHQKVIKSMIPNWWGIIICRENNDQIIFNKVRRPKINNYIDSLSIAELLWKNEAIEILLKKGLSNNISRKPRRILYQYIQNHFNIVELKHIVKNRLQSRTAWRGQISPFLNDDLHLSSTML